MAPRAQKRPPVDTELGQVSTKRAKNLPVDTTNKIAKKTGKKGARDSVSTIASETDHLQESVITLETDNVQESVSISGAENLQNDTSAPVADLNDTSAPVADLNDTFAPVADLNDTSAPVADLSDTSAPVADLNNISAPVADLNNISALVANLNNTTVEIPIEASEPVEKSKVTNALGKTKKNLKATGKATKTVTLPVEVPQVKVSEKQNTSKTENTESKDTNKNNEPKKSEEHEPAINEQIEISEPVVLSVAKSAKSKAEKKNQETTKATKKTDVQVETKNTKKPKAEKPMQQILQEIDLPERSKSVLRALMLPEHEITVEQKILKYIYNSDKPLNTTTLHENTHKCAKNKVELEKLMEKLSSGEEPKVNCKWFGKVPIYFPVSIVTQEICKVGMEIYTDILSDITEGASEEQFEESLKSKLIRLRNVKERSNQLDSLNQLKLDYNAIKERITSIISEQGWSESEVAKRIEQRKQDRKFAHSFAVDFAPKQKKFVEIVNTVLDGQADVNELAVLKMLDCSSDDLEGFRTW